jgi:Protein of unknown function (DUF1254)
MVFCGEFVVTAWRSVVIWMVVFARQENFTFSKIFLWKFMTVRRESQDVHAPGMPPVVACPNQDVVYGFSLLDMAQEPIVIQVPDFGDRFWVYQIVDQRTDSFVEMGKMYGTKPGFYLLTGPEWKGTAPSGNQSRFSIEDQSWDRHSSRFHGRYRRGSQGHPACPYGDSALSAQQVHREDADHRLGDASKLPVVIARGRRDQVGRTGDFFRRPSHRVERGSITVRRRSSLRQLSKRSRCCSEGFQTEGCAGCISRRGRREFDHASLSVS